MQLPINQLTLKDPLDSVNLNKPLTLKVSTGIAAALGSPLS